MEEQRIEKLIEENKLLKEKINELTEHLKKYTAPCRNKNKIWKRTNFNNR